MTDLIITEEPAKPSHRSKRKPAKVSREMITSITSVELLNIEDMFLKANGSTKAHFKRLKYKGCPILSKKGELKQNVQHIDMERDHFVRQMYYLFRSEFNISLWSYFGCLCKYVKWLDDQNYTQINNDFFHNELIKLYMQQWGTWVRQGRYSLTSWTSSKMMLSFILKRLNRSEDAKRLPIIKGTSQATKHHKSIHIESELKPTARTLFRGFKAFAKHIEDDTIPMINHLWDEGLFNAQAQNCLWSTRQRAANFRRFKYSVKGCGDWRNQLTRITAMICFIFTGMNYTPLMQMKRKDVKFKQIQGGKYIFEAEKARASHLEIDNAMGFSKHAREFIERWLFLSAKITGSNKNAYLFPFIRNNGEIVSFIQANKQPQTSVNKLLKVLGLTAITSSILRKTKLDTLMKVTEDIYLVSISGNNSIGAIKKSYSGGLEQDHKRNLGAAMEAKFNIAKGKAINDAVCAAKQNFHDVLSVYDYKKMRKKEQVNKESMTPLGVRCQDNQKGAASIIDKALKRSGIEMPTNEVICTDFLECFSCESHALVAAVDDIWLMLSFQETLKEMQQFPSVNSLPESRYNNLCLTIDSVLASFKEISKKNYLQAIEKKKSASHPLYSTLYSLNDLMEVFA